MADYKGVKYTKADDPKSSNITDPGVLEGKLRVMQDKYEASSVATGKTIAMGKDLPEGARIIDIQVKADALSSSVTLAVGDSDTADRYIAATSMNTGNKAITLVEDGKIAGVHYEIGTNDGDETILITTGGATASGTIRANIIYAVE